MRIASASMKPIGMASFRKSYSVGTARQAGAWPSAQDLAIETRYTHVLGWGFCLESCRGETSEGRLIRNLRRDPIQDRMLWRVIQPEPFDVRRKPIPKVFFYLRLLRDDGRTDIPRLWDRVLPRSFGSLLYPSFVVSFDVSYSFFLPYRRPLCAETFGACAQ